MYNLFRASCGLSGFPVDLLYHLASLSQPHAGIANVGIAWSLPPPTLAVALAVKSRTLTVNSRTLTVNSRTLTVDLPTLTVDAKAISIQRRFLPTR